MATTPLPHINKKPKDYYYNKLQVRKIRFYLAKKNITSIYTTPNSATDLWCVPIFFHCKTFTLHSWNSRDHCLELINKNDGSELLSSPYLLAQRFNFPSIAYQVSNIGIDSAFILGVFFSVVIILFGLKKILTLISMLLLYVYSKNQKIYRKFVQLTIWYGKHWPSILFWGWVDKIIFITSDQPDSSTNLLNTQMWTCNLFKNM